MKNILIILLLLLLTLNLSLFAQVNDVEILFTKNNPSVNVGNGNPNALRSGNIGFVDHLKRNITLTKTSQFRDTWVG
jgi:hypothetical protein